MAHRGPLKWVRHFYDLKQETLLAVSIIGHWSHNYFCIHAASFLSSSRRDDESDDSGSAVDSSRKVKSSVWKKTVVSIVKNFFLSSFTSLYFSERETSKIVQNITPVRLKICHSKTKLTFCHIPMPKRSNHVCAYSLSAKSALHRWPMWGKRCYIWDKLHATFDVMAS